MEDSHVALPPCGLLEHENIPVRVDAELIGWAIVASALAFGDDPVAAMTTANNNARRSRTAAAAALADVLELTNQTAARLTGIREKTLSYAKRYQTPSFGHAKRGAEDALRALLAKRAARGRGADLSADRPRPSGWGGLADPRPAPDAAAPPEGSLGDRILSLLAEEGAAWTPVALATVLDAKELYVGQALSLLRHQGLATADELTERGPRAQVWRIKSGVER